ncbi:Transcriptional elongation regulator MINIYO [Spatholobus suberectus]|nr:Transcriptional elongation regulator MINIYO [Spatholobus suberectus]
MVDLTIKWIATRSDPEVSKFFEGQEERRCDFTFQDLSATPLLWVYASVTHMLFRVLEWVTWGDTISSLETKGHVPWLPESVPKIGLELIKYWLLSFSPSFGTKCGRDSEASTCCLNGMVRIITTFDHLIQSAKTGICSLPRQEQSLSKEGKVLKDGIVNGCLVELRSRNWMGCPGGGFWSASVLLAQTDARFLVYLLEIFENESKDVRVTEVTTFTMQRVNAGLGLRLTAGPRDKNVIISYQEQIVVCKGVEAMPNFQGTDIPSPIQHVSLTWKLLSLSVNFLAGMEILEQDRSRDTFETLEDLYGAEEYLEPTEDNEAILEAYYTKSWVSDALDRAAIRGLVAYTLPDVTNGTFVTGNVTEPHPTMGEQLNGILSEKSWLVSRLKILVQACEGNSSLLTIPGTKS